MVVVLVVVGSGGEEEEASLFVRFRWIARTRSLRVRVVRRWGWLVAWLVGCVVGSLEGWWFTGCVCVRCVAVVVVTLQLV